MPGIADDRPPGRLRRQLRGPVPSVEGRMRWVHARPSLHGSRVMYQSCAPVHRSFLRAAAFRRPSACYPGIVPSYSVPRLAAEKDSPMNSVECSGSCLCGAVSYRITGRLSRFTLCHCGRCRKAAGSGHTSNILLAQGRVEWVAGEDCIRRYKVPEAERYSTCFCGRCGSPLPRLISETGMVAVPAGSLDKAPGLTPQAHIFWDSRADWLTPATDLPKYAEYPPGVE